MEFGLKELDTVTRATEGVDMPLISPKGLPVKDKDGNPVTIRLCGSDSDRFRRARADSIVDRAAKGNTGALSVGDISEAEANTIELLAACTIGWSGVNTPDGKPIPCIPDNVKALYRAYPVIRDQADLFIGNRANFLGSSPKG